MNNELYDDIISQLYTNGKYHGNRIFHRSELKLKLENLRLDKYESIYEKIWSLVNNVEIRPLCYCGSTTKFLNVNTGFRRYCSTKCLATSLDTNNKRKLTVELKYGADSVAKVPSLLKKRVESRAFNYKFNGLHSRLKELNSLDIVPYGWKSEDYLGANVEHDYYHMLCDKVFTSKLKVYGRLLFCPNCNTKGSSNEEVKLVNDLIKIFPKLIRKDRKIIKPKEIDVVIDNIGIEINGIYWHNDSSNKMTLLEKSNMSPIQILHFWDIEINNKYDICKSIILSKFSIYNKKIDSNLCTIELITPDNANTFFNNNHLSGEILADCYYGLKYNDELLMCVSVKISGNNIEIYRISSKLNILIIDGTLKLIKNLREKFKKNIYIYSDKRYCDGIEFDNLGFTELNDSPPNYFWAKKEIITPSNEVNKLLDFDNKLTEVENMIKNKYLKIVDCGNKVFSLSYKGENYAM